ncbi:MAG: c-type cytochrome [Alphaproteobacteria bacterium]
MHPQRISIRRLFILVAAATALVFGYSAASIAIDPGPPAAEEVAPADAAAETGPGTGVVEIDEARLIAGLEAYKEGGCRGCHGWAANGAREGPSPEGPSLREMLLPMDFVRVTVACGRPNTAMPYFWREAYRRDSTECYGQTADQLGALTPPRGAGRLTDLEIDDLTYYLEYYVKGLGEIAFDECEFFFGEGNTRCEFYR